MEYRRDYPFLPIINVYRGFTRTPTTQILIFAGQRREGVPSGSTTTNNNINNDNNNNKNTQETGSTTRTAADRHGQHGPKNGNNNGNNNNNNTGYATPLSSRPHLVASFSLAVVRKDRRWRFASAMTAWLPEASSRACVGTSSSCQHVSSHWST